MNVNKILKTRNKLKRMIYLLLSIFEKQDNLTKVLIFLNIILLMNYRFKVVAMSN